MKTNKLKYQLYIFQLITFLLLIAFLGITYYFYQAQYKKDINTFIQNEINIYKKEIYSSIESASQKMNKQKKYFISIHEKALKKLQENPDLSLEDLKKDIKEEYLLKHINLELFLIDKSYTIYKTTYLKDLGFNLSVVTEAKQFLDQTTKDGNIYISDFLSTDALDMKYKLYSYSKLTDNNYLELGFIDNTLTNTMSSLLKLNTNKLSKISLFNVSKDDKQYYYYEMKERVDTKSKEEHYKSFVTIPINQITDDNIINSVKHQNNIHIENNNIHTIYAKIYNKNMFPVLGFDNIVLKLEIDISEKLDFLDNYKKIFIFAIFILCIIQIVLIIMTKYKFTAPIEEISLSLSSSTKVNNETLLFKNNELSEIAIKYNELYDKLNQEIELNKKLTLIDQLTNAYNRKAFDHTMIEVLSLYKRYKTPFSLIIFDIDDFKKINDSYGHIAGDKVLKKLVKLINKNIRKTDTLYRIGGEEFIIVCKNTSQDDTFKVAEKIRTEIEESLSIIENHTITASIGITGVLDGDNADSIYSRVDKNLYHSKNTGKNKITGD